MDNCELSTKLLCLLLSSCQDDSEKTSELRALLNLTLSPTIALNTGGDGNTWLSGSTGSTGSSSPLLQSPTRQIQTTSRPLIFDRSISAPAGVIQSPNTTTTRYKTEMCRQFLDHGVCRYADKCQFAHGQQELRTVLRHPRYKTEMCRTFHTTGFCPYGLRCHFIHTDDVIQSPAPITTQHSARPILSRCVSAVVPPTTQCLHGLTAATACWPI